MARAKQLSEGLVAVERLAEAHAKHRAVLVERVSVLDREMREIKRRRLAGIRTAAAAAADSYAALQAAIEQNKAEFDRPRTRTFHGIKVGLRKLIGKLTWTDVDKVVLLIKKHFPDQVELLVKTTETPVKGALEQLPANDLKKLGVTVGEDSDEIVISDTASDIDKVVDALLKDSNSGGDA